MVWFKWPQAKGFLNVHLSPLWILRARSNGLRFPWQRRHKIIISLLRPFPPSAIVPSRSFLSASSPIYRPSSPHILSLLRSLLRFVERRTRTHLEAASFLSTLSLSVCRLHRNFSRSFLPPFLPFFPFLCLYTHSHNPLFYYYHTIITIINIIIIIVVLILLLILLIENKDDNNRSYAR